MKTPALRRRFTYANVMSTLAFALAVGGGVTFAAISGVQIKANSLTGAKIKNDSITGLDVKESSLKKVQQAHQADKSEQAAKALKADLATNATNAANAAQAAHAAAADSATNADSAADASKLGGKLSSLYLTSDDVVEVHASSEYIGSFNGTVNAPGDFTAWTSGQGPDVIVTNHSANQNAPGWSLPVAAPATAGGKAWKLVSATLCAKDIGAGGTVSFGIYDYPLLTGPVLAHGYSSGMSGAPQQCVTYAPAGGVALDEDKVMQLNLLILLPPAQSATILGYKYHLSAV